MRPASLLVPSAIALTLVAAATAAEIVVHNSDELRAALGSDRSVVLEPGDYVSGETIVVRDVSNLHLSGRSRDTTRILARDSMDDVLRFERARGVTVSNLTLGHHPDVAECMGGVLVFSQASDIKVEMTTMFGSGVEGLTLHKVDGFEMNQSTIRECTASVMSVVDSRRVTIRASDFVDNDVWIGQINAIASQAVFEQVTLRNRASGDGQLDLVRLDELPGYHDSDIVTSTSTAPSQVLFRGGKLAGPLVLPPASESRVVIENVDTSQAEIQGRMDEEGPGEGEEEGDPEEGDPCGELVRQERLGFEEEMKAAAAELVRARARIAELEAELAKCRR